METWDGVVWVCNAQLLSFSFETPRCYAVETILKQSHWKKLETRQSCFSKEFCSITGRKTFSSFSLQSHHPFSVFAFEKRRHKRRNNSDIESVLRQSHSHGLGTHTKRGWCVMLKTNGFLNKTGSQVKKAKVKSYLCKPACFLETTQSRLKGGDILRSFSPFPYLYSTLHLCCYFHSVCTKLDGKNKS